MKSHIRLSLAIILALVTLSTQRAQRPEEILATSKGMTYKLSSLSPEGQKLYLEQRKVVGDARTRLLSEMISDILLELESKALKSTPDDLLKAQQAKVPAPTAAQIQAVYNANKDTLGGRTLNEVRPQIVEFLTHDSEDKAVAAFIKTLNAKYKVVLGKGINTIGLSPTDVLATIGARTITVRDFENSNRVSLNDTEMQIYEELVSDLESSIFSAVVAEDAKARNMDTGGYIAAEITDKLRSFTPEERAGIESSLMRQLFAKYDVKILLASPTSIVHNVSVDDDPTTGLASAPVTVVMFSDFQCSACARTHPVLKQVLSEYGDKVRFVVRDFPLENIHKDAFPAALAANAAGAQGKFAEYVEILYRNQDALNKPSLLKYAAELGLNVKQFELDFTDAKTAAEIRKDQADGRSHGVSGTPAIFINGVKLHRLSPVAFRSAIDRALKK